MNQDNKKNGFTLIELMLSMAFVSILLLAIAMLVKAVGIAVHMITGNKSLNAAQNVDWKARLADLENPKIAYKILKRTHPKGFGAVAHG